MQFDIDIVGTTNLLADSVIIAAMVRALDHLGVNNFEVRYSNRKILNGLIEWAGIDAERGPDIMRVLDKYEKQGKGAVLDELGAGKIDDSGAEIPGLHLPNAQIERIESFIDQALQTRLDDPLGWVEKELVDHPAAVEGLEELRKIQHYLSTVGIDEKKAAVDLTIVRGLGYYTGPVFETTLKDLPEFGSVFSGGRYDNLVDRFLGRSIPAVGSSIGIDRLLAALIELKALTLKESTSQVLVTIMDRDRVDDYLKILESLRAAGIPSEIYSGDTRNLTKQIKYGDKVGIPFAVIAGSDEFEQKKITVKNLIAGREKAQATEDREEWLKADDIQETIPADTLIEYLKEHLDL
jgi:histidyl-tRNA synthetase